jgi:outer membrane protein assembly factor BamB
MKDINLKRVVLSIIFFGISVSSILSQVDSQWRGENRDGKYHDEKLLKAWPPEGPPLLTTIEGLGIGYSSPAVTDDRIYITGMEEGTGYLFAFELSGKLLWKKAYGVEWEDDFPGARAIPTVAGDKIYFSSSIGKVFCYKDDGSLLWSVNQQNAYGMPLLEFGVVESHIVDGDYIFCTPGSKDVSMVVLNRHTGKEIKRIIGNGQPSTYSSPLIVKHNGIRILVTRLQKSVIGVDLESLEIIFEHFHSSPYDVNPVIPLYHNGYIYVVSGDTRGGQLFKLSEDATKTTQVWSDSTLDCQVGGVQLVDGHLYGSGHMNRNWHCIEFMTGKWKYSSRKLGRQGCIIFSDGMLYIYSEKGDVALVKPNSEKFDIVSTFKLKAGSGEHWAHPVIKDGKFYVRHGDIMNIYDIARK